MFSLQGAKSRLTTLLESGIKNVLTHVNGHVVFCGRTKSVTQNIRGFIQRPLRAARRDAWEPHAARRTVVDNH